MRSTFSALALPLVLILTSCAPVSTELDPATQRLQEIETMGYDKIDFSISRSQFVSQFRGALKVPSDDDELGVAHYAIQGVDDETDVIGFEFFGEKLMNLLISYQGDHIDQLGGAEGLRVDAIKRFGPPTEENEIGTVWSFPTIDRKIVSAMQQGMWTLSIQRTSLVEQLQKTRPRLTEMQSDEPQSSRSTKNDKRSEGLVYWRPTAAERAEMEAEIANAANQSSGSSRTTGERFGLSELERKQIFRQIAAVEDRASREAMTLVPNSMVVKQIEVQDKLEKNYKVKLARRYQLTQNQLLEIAVEGVTKRWAY